MKPYIAGLVAIVVVCSLIALERQQEKANYHKLTHDIEEVRQDGLANMRGAFWATRLDGLRGADVQKNAAPLRAEIESQEEVKKGSAPIETNKQAIPTPRQEVEFVATIHQGQDRDQAWARESEGELEKELVTIAAGQSKVASVDCRQTLCRAEIVHHGEDGFYTFTNSIMGNLHWKGASMFLRDTDLASGDIKSLMFFAKTDMPPMRTNAATE